jgi:hypothetical protein
LILHPVVAELIAGLAESPLRAWAQAVVWVLSGAGVQDSGLETAADGRNALVEDVLRDPAAFCGSMEIGDALRQLKTVERAITHQVAHELSVLARIAELAALVGADDVRVVGPRYGAGASLLEDAQPRALRDFYARFTKVMQLARRQIETWPEDHD